MIPKGKLVVIGGSIEMNVKKIKNLKGEFSENVILPKIIQLAGGSNSRIEVITCASSIPDEVWNDYEEVFRKLGVDNIGNLFFRGEEVANSPEKLKRIEKADMLLFTGGNQDNIRKSIKDTKTHELMMTRYLQDDIVIAGTSAGAMTISEEIILGEKLGNGYNNYDLLMGKGLGFLNQAIIDTHFTQRARLDRLAEAVSFYPDKLGIGIGENTAIVINEGNDCEVIGSGKVIFIEGTHLKQNEKANIERGKNNGTVPLFDLVVHILFPQDRYYIDEREPVSLHKQREFLN